MHSRGFEPASLTFAGASLIYYPTGVHITEANRIRSQYTADEICKDEDTKVSHRLSQQ